MKNYTGLNNQEVKQRIDKQQTNHFYDQTHTTNKDIILRHVFTLFNFLNVVLALFVLFTKKYQNMLFMQVVIINTVIVIVQELRSKHKLDKLKVLHQSKAHVLRQGQEVTIQKEDIVLDDILLLKLGDEVVADCKILEGHLEVNESMLTGESNSISKTVGEEVLSGSSILSGNAYCKVIRVGKDTYINGVLSHLKQSKKQKAILKDTISNIIKIITYIIVPLSLFLFLKQFYLTRLSLNESILKTVASSVGMIPEGLILLISISLAIGSIYLANHDTLIQEIHAIDTLARIDDLCVDKTGTLTTGNMEVKEIISIDPSFDASNILANLTNYLKDQNPTTDAISKYCLISQVLPIINGIHFNSTNKYSLISTQRDTYTLGAYNFIQARIEESLEKTITNYTSQGHRILALAHASNQQEGLPNENTIIALIVLTDELKQEAKGVLQHFKEQEVTVRILSGDDYHTVKAISKALDLDLSIMDCSNVLDEELIQTCNDYQIFTRVKPLQKKLILHTLKQQGRITAMVGDGINDAFALKEADISIAMANGYDAIKSISHIILLDNNFNHLVEILNQGRRVINNITLSSTLFLTKTTFSILLTLFTILFLPAYPFIPIQLTLLSSLFIGIPSFILTMESNFKPISKQFMKLILSKAIPCGISVVFAVILLYGMHHFYPIPDSLTTMIFYVTAAIMYYILVDTSYPFTPIRKYLLIGIFFTFLICVSFFHHFFEITYLTLTQWFIVAIATILSILLLNFIRNIFFKQTKTL